MVDSFSIESSSYTHSNFSKSTLGYPKSDSTSSQSNSQQSSCSTSIHTSRSYSGTLLSPASSSDYSSSQFSSDGDSDEIEESDFIKANAPINTDNLYTVAAMRFSEEMASTTVSSLWRTSISSNSFDFGKSRTCNIDVVPSLKESERSNTQALYEIAARVFSEETPSLSPGSSVLIESGLNLRKNIPMKSTTATNKENAEERKQIVKMKQAKNQPKTKSKSFVMTRSSDKASCSPIASSDQSIDLSHDSTYKEHSSLSIDLSDSSEEKSQYSAIVMPSNKTGSTHPNLHASNPYFFPKSFGCNTIQQSEKFLDDKSQYSAIATIYDNASNLSHYSMDTDKEDSLISSDLSKSKSSRTISTNESNLNHTHYDGLEIQSQYSAIASAYIKYYDSYHDSCSTSNHSKMHNAGSMRRVSVGTPSSHSSISSDSYDDDSQQSCTVSLTTINIEKNIFESDNESNVRRDGNISSDDKSLRRNNSSDDSKNSTEGKISSNITNNNNSTANQRSRFKTRVFNSPEKRDIDDIVRLVSSVSDDCEVSEDNSSISDETREEGLFSPTPNTFLNQKSRKHRNIVLIETDDTFGSDNTLSSNNSAGSNFSSSSDTGECSSRGETDSIYDEDLLSGNDVKLEDLHDSLRLHFKTDDEYVGRSCCW